MLKFIRRNATALWVKIVFGAIIVVFMTWGVGAVISGGGEIVARVNGENIDTPEYKRAYDGMVRFYENLYKDAFTPEIMRAMNLPARTVDQLINTRLMKQEAERLGLTVTDSELRDTIASNTAFHNDGGFNRSIYLQVLRANNMGPADYEEAEREGILVSKIRDLITAGVLVNEADVRARFDYDNEKVNLSFVKVDPDQFRTGIEITDEGLQEYYDANQDQFRLPDRVELEYVAFPNARFEEAIEISDTEAREYYDANQDEFSQEEEVRAAHILIRIEDGADEAAKAAARQRAEEVLAKAKAGEDFSKLAAENSEDSSASRGGDLGFFRRGLMVPPFEAAAFAMQPGEISDVVESQFGFHIIRVIERHEAGAKPFADVHDQIVAKLKSERAQATIREKTTAAHTELTSGKTLEEIAAAEGLEVKTTGPLAKTDRVAGVNGTGLLNAAFALEETGDGPIVTTPDGQILFRVTAKVPAEVPDLAAIREQVDKAARAQLAADKAKNVAEEILSVAKEKGLGTAAQAHGLTVEESGPVGRGDTSVGAIGAAPQLAQQAFELTADSPVAPVVYQVGDDSIVAALKERIPADPAEFETEKAQLIEAAEGRLRNSVLTDFVMHLRSQAEIVLGKGYEMAPAPNPL